MQALPYNEAIQILRNLASLYEAKRRANGITLQNAAIQIGISVSCLWRFENEPRYNMSTDKAIRVMAWLAS